MNGRKYVPGLDGYDAGEYPTLSVWDEQDRQDSADVLLGDLEDTEDVA